MAHKAHIPYISRTKIEQLNSVSLKYEDHLPHNHTQQNFTRMCLLQSQYSATQIIKKEQIHEVLLRFISKKPLQSTRRKSKESPNDNAYSYLKPRKCANSTTATIF